MRQRTRRNRNTARFVASFMLCVVLAVSMQSNVQYARATESTETAATVTDSKDTTNVDANGVLGKNSDIGIELKDSITGEIGSTDKNKKKTKIEFTVKSNHPDTVKLKSIYPVIDNAFPFETSGDAYKVVSADNEEKQKSMGVKFELKPRADLTAGYQSIRFISEYSKIAADGTVTDYYVIKTINIYFSVASSGNGSTGSSGSNGSGGGSSGGSTEDDDGGDDDDDRTPSSGGYSGGGGSDDEATAPKLLITGFDTKPEKIMAGEAFELTIHLQNTSKSTSVCNGKFLIGNEAGNFVPTAGSSAVFVDKIEPGKTGDLKIEFKTSADLPQKTYALVVKGDFDDGKGNTFTSSDTLSIPVYQEVKLGVTDVSMSPDAIGIGQTGTMMFTINNQGNAGVYNVTVSVDDEAVSAEQSYVGNIAASSSAYATLDVTGQADNSEKGTIKVVVSYEDSEGAEGKLEQEIACYVGENVEFGMDGFENEEDWDSEEESGLPVWLLILLIVLGVAVIAVVTVLLIKRRKKKQAELFADDEDEDEFGEDDIENEDF